MLNNEQETFQCQFCHLYNVHTPFAQNLVLLEKKIHQHLFSHQRVRLPANPSILHILENYVKDYARELLVADDDSKAAESDQESGARSMQKALRQQRPRKRQRRVSSNSSCDGEEDKEFQQIVTKFVTPVSRFRSQC